MVETSDIKDRDSLKNWLMDQPSEVSVWIASRAAARVLPVWWQAVLTEEWARKSDVTALPVLRSLFVSPLAAIDPTDNLNFAIATSAGAAEDAARAARVAGAGRIARVADAARAANFTDAMDARAGAADAARAAPATNAADTAAAWTGIRIDAEHLEGGKLLDALPLWPDGQNPFEREWSEIKAQVAASPGAVDWQFWLDWYDAQLAGRTLLSDPAQTQKMLEEIALIDPATWDAGPEVVTPRIREIWDLYRLRSEVAALQAEKEAFLAARASHAQRSHNQPPAGLVDDQPELARQITIVWDSLDEARDELEQDDPDKSRLRAIAERLGAALNAIVQYCGKVANAGILAAAVTFGGKVGNEFADHLIANGRLMQFAKDLLSYASGG